MLSQCSGFAIDWIGTIVPILKQWFRDIRHILDKIWNLLLPSAHLYDTWCHVAEFFNMTFDVLWDSFYHLLSIDSCSFQPQIAQILLHVIAYEKAMTIICRRHRACTFLFSVGALDFILGNWCGLSFGKYYLAYISSSLVILSNPSTASLMRLHHQIRCYFI